MATSTNRQRTDRFFTLSRDTQAVDYMITRYLHYRGVVILEWHIQRIDVDILAPPCTITFLSYWEQNV